MSNRALQLICFVWLLFGLLEPAAATQVHADPEGVHAHQIAHLFFAFSMGILIYWLRERDLVQETGWRFVQYAAFFFILWNIEAIITHYLDGWDETFDLINAGTWNAWVPWMKDSSSLVVLYYLFKMDHLLCLPGIIFLYAGLRQLLKQAQANGPA